MDDLSFQPITTRSQQLQQLSSQMPGQTALSAQGAQAGQQAQTQQAIQAAVMGGSQVSAGQIQQAGAQQTQQRGQIANQAAQQQAQQQMQLGQMGLQEQQMSYRQNLANKQISLSQENRQMTQQLSQLNIALKGELIDKQEQFQKDEMGRTLFNERQLMDYQLNKATSEQDMYNYEQQVQQASQKRMQLLKAAQAKIIQQMEQANQLYNQQQNEKTQQDLLKYKQQIELKIQREKANAANRAAMFQGIGSLFGPVGGGVGAVLSTVTPW